MTLPELIVVFRLDDQRYGIDLAATELVLAAVEVTPLPKAPPIVLGIFNLHGRIVPVVNIRRRFALPDREISPSNQFVVARAGARLVALVVDSTSGALDLPPADVVELRTILPEVPYVFGVVRLPDGIILIHDLSTFLALDEAEALDDAVRTGRECG